MRLAAAAALAVTLTAAPQPPDMTVVLAALARTAATFSRSVPGLTAREALHQRARQADMQIRKEARDGEPRSIAFVIPDDFESHAVVADYSFAPLGEANAFHEKRRIISVDEAPPKDTVRHALTLDANDPDTQASKGLLEDLEHSRLQGAAADFGPFLLLFLPERQHDFEFHYAGAKTWNKTRLLLVNFRQISGPAAFTEFRERGVVRHPLSGQLWLNPADYIPVRITIATEEILSPKYTLRNEAEIDYQPTPYGLAPATILHRQFVNHDLLVENHFTYSDYRGRAFAP